MKQFILLSVIICAAFCACGSNNANPKLPHDAAKDTANFTTIQWLDSAKNFGTAKFGDKVNIKYAFINSGNKPLFLLNVQPTCGCTIADYTKNAVMPGDKGYVKAVYDSRHGMPGAAVRKSIIVSSNTKNDAQFVLTFTGEVVK